ncbi:HEPN domain-containing protein [Candidatus Nanosalina sp. VS9-1]|uniref:HEPN domain-containing protein n=1 Tax=Candidatus Nanosalina sp. VS9-1 TaxID=3388566 RepID=UPI0039E10B5B
MSSRIEESLEEAESYIEAANKQYEKALENDTWNPVIVSCIMAMIKSIDALMLEYRGETNQDHSKTANQLQKLYEEGLISDNFKSNIDSVKKWVVNEKTDIQYRNKSVSQKDADRAIKSAERLLKKTEKEIG